MAEDGADDPDDGVVIPFPKISQQEKGRRHEKKQAKRQGLSLHPASGAGSIKHDASDEETLLEYKHAKKSFSMNGKYLRDLMVRGIHEDKEPILEVTFEEAGVTATVLLGWSYKE